MIAMHGPRVGTHMQLTHKYVHIYTYGTAQQQLDTRTWVASWPTTFKPAESV